jgi:hypothetical protein
VQLKLASIRVGELLERLAIPGLGACQSIDWHGANLHGVNLHGTSQHRPHR